MLLAILKFDKKYKKMMKIYYVKQTLKKPSQGVRFEYIREIRYMLKEDVEVCFWFGENETNKAIPEYEIIPLVKVKVDWKNYQNCVK